MNNRILASTKFSFTVSTIGIEVTSTNIFVFESSIPMFVYSFQCVGSCLEDSIVPEGGGYGTLVFGLAHSLEENKNITGHGVLTTQLT